MLQVTKDLGILFFSTNVVCRRKDGYIKGTKMAERDEEGERERERLTDFRKERRLPATNPESSGDELAMVMLKG